MAASDTDDYRFSMPAEKYLEEHDVMIYMEDAVTQLLDHKEENPKVNPTKFFSEYFSSVKEGNHVIFREYSYINCTLHNRSSFVRNVWKCFRHIGRKGDLLSIREYHSLISLLCPDFPFQPLQKTARIILMEDAMDSLISFTDFLYAFQVQFCYDEFLTESAEVFKGLLHSHGNSEPVVVPTSENGVVPAKPGTWDGAIVVTEPSSMVESAQLLRALSAIAEKMNKKAPPVHVLREILLAAKKTTFYGFLMALAKSETLNTSIGKLPNKAELLDISDQELTSPVTQPCSGQGQPVLASSPTSLPPAGEPTEPARSRTRAMPTTAALRKQLAHSGPRKTTKPSTPDYTSSDTDT